MLLYVLIVTKYLITLYIVASNIKCNFIYYMKVCYTFIWDFLLCKLVMSPILIVGLSDIVHKYICVYFVAGGGEGRESRLYIMYTGALCDLLYFQLLPVIK